MGNISSLILYIFITSTFILPGKCSAGLIPEPEITVDELKQHIEYLSSDYLAGRYPGSEGDKMAAGYIREQFKRSGLQLRADNGFQYFSLTTGIELGRNNKMIINNIKIEPGTGYTPLSFTGNTDLTAEVAFCGYGFDIDEHDLQWNDYSGIDVTGKWVMVLRGAPGQETSSGIFSSYTNDRWKAYKASENGAAGIILVSGEGYDKEDRLERIRSHHGKVGIPVIQVTRPVADMILSITEQSVNDLESYLNIELKPESFLVNTIISASTDVLVTEAQTMNVIGSIPGNDPDLKDEYILIGAHFDHLGTGGEGSGSRTPDMITPHPGADDNASGVAALIELAGKISSQRETLRRSYIFVAFGAEEKGLLGSKHFAENPVTDLTNIKTMINLDMIGRKREDKVIQTGGVGTSVEGESIINMLISEYDLSTSFFREGYGPSDHASFYAKNIPVFFFTTGPHQDYHTPYDTADKINYKGLKNITGFIYDLAIELGKMEHHLTFREAGPSVPVSTGHGNRRISLGIMPDFTFSGRGGLRADFVTPGRPAAIAGMEKGDIIIAINGSPVKDIYEYMYRLEQLSEGEIINVEVIRNDGKEILIIQL